MIQNLTMEGLNHTTVVSVFTGTSSELSNAIGPFLHDLFANHLTELASRMFTFSIIWKVLVIFLILSNVKSLPLIWHVSISPSEILNYPLTVLPASHHQRFPLLSAISALRRPFNLQIHLPSADHNNIPRTSS